MAIIQVASQDVGPNPLVDICAGWCIMNYIN